MEVLVVVDMQNDFICGALGSSAAIKIVDNVVDSIKSFDGMVLATQDTHESDYTRTQEADAFSPHCMEGSWGWKIHSVVEDALIDRNAEVFIKSTFGSVRLVGYLREAYVRGDLHITLVGLVTDICVISNALMLKANFPEARITVDSKCCAGSSLENHEAALKVLRACQVEVL